MDFDFFDDLFEEEAPAEEAVGEGYRHIWVLVERRGDAPLSASLETLGQARELADQIGVYVYGLLLGDKVEPLAEALFAHGADQVFVAEDAALGDYLPGLYTQIVADLVEQHRPEILLMAATPLGNDLAPRLAQRLETGLMSHCVKVELDLAERLLLGTYPVLDGEMYHTAACPEARPQMATLEPGYFALPYADGSRSGQMRTVDLELGQVQPRLTWLDRAAAVDLPPVPLKKARIVVAAGRGLGDAEGFALAEQLAEALGGVVAGSRGAFDEGWIAEEQIVGVGGEFIAPDLYIACGLSGDVFHYFGLQEAKYIVAINTDETAPIMKIANMAVVGDAKQIIPAMLEALRR